MAVQLWALSDLHVEHERNRNALSALRARPDDWLILAGDVSDSVRGLIWAIETLAPKFARLLWVPGNHELWTRPDTPREQRGQGRYDELVAACRARSVLTPEDEYVRWPALVDGKSVLLAPLFLLYDYTFAPDEHRGRERAVAWAAESGIQAADEILLSAEPYPSREAWCAARLEATRARLRGASEQHQLVLINHWPLRHDLVRLGLVPRYAPWCGTRETDDWHLRFRALACVHGHLHVRATDVRDDVRFEEVSLGYPRDWNEELGADHYLRRIL